MKAKLKLRDPKNSKTENTVILGDFNIEVKEKNISDFMSTYNMKKFSKTENMFFKKNMLF